MAAASAARERARLTPNGPFGFCAEFTNAFVGGDWDHRPHELLDEWEAEQIFKSVTWEEDKEQSAADERQAEEEISGWLTMIDQGEATAD
ncbi:hypothetical protein ACW4TU_24975 [Streptomyces sp. QTS52]